MKQTFLQNSTAKTVGAVLVAATILPMAAYADTAAGSSPADSDYVLVHPRFKDGEGTGWIKANRPSSEQDSNIRHEQVASFRVETDAQGRKWALVHPQFKHCEGAGWVRVPLENVK